MVQKVAKRGERDYARTPLAQKLGLREGSRMAFINAPEYFEQLLQPLPDGARISTLEGGGLDLIVYFVTSRVALSRRFEDLAAALNATGGLWVAWPKKAARIPTDVSEDAVRHIGLAAGVVDNKVCAIDDVWSGLRFVVRKTDRPVRVQ